MKEELIELIKRHHDGDKIRLQEVYGIPDSFIESLAEAIVQKIQDDSKYSDGNPDN